MPEILISVVVPAYNYAALLPRALDSVLAQWADDIELIVINDGSQDDTEQVLDAYVREHSGKIQVVHQQNAGVGAARNRGIAMACGRYALLLDADDELMPDALATLREVVAANPQIGMVLGAHISVYANGRQRLRLPTPAQGSVLQLVERYLLDKKISISHCCTLFRRDLLLLRPYPESLRSGEDVAVFAYLLISAPVAVTYQPLARIYKHDDSLRHSRDDDEEAQARHIIREVFSRLPAECQHLMLRYEAQRFLSMFRAAQIAGDRLVAWRFYWQALRLSPRQAIRWIYVRKVLRLLLKS